LKLFCFASSPYSKKVIGAMRELEIECECVDVPPFVPAEVEKLRKAHYPLATIPLLVRDGDAPIFDSSLIIELFDSIARSPGRLLPADRAFRVRLVDRFAESLLTPTVYLTWALRAPTGKRNDKRIATMLAQVETGLDYAESLLDGPFFVGETLTLADLSVAAAVSTLLHDRTIQSVGNRPRLLRWFEGVTSRASWQYVTAETKRLADALPPMEAE
jgi:glutathione S-transferase